MCAKKYNILQSKKFDAIKQWKLDKTLFNANTLVVDKIELYNYIPRKSVPKLIKFFERKSFERTNDTRRFHKIFNIILEHSGQHIYKGKVIDDRNSYKYYYFVDFARVLVHRGSTFLVKIYRNKSKDKNFSKVEITYGRHKGGYGLYYGDWASKLKGITEIINKLEKHFEFIGYEEDFSEKQDVIETIESWIDCYDEGKRNKLIQILK